PGRRPRRPLPPARRLAAQGLAQLHRRRVRPGQPPRHLEALPRHLGGRPADRAAATDTRPALVGPRTRAARALPADAAAAAAAAPAAARPGARRLPAHRKGPRRRRTVAPRRRPDDGPHGRAPAPPARPDRTGGAPCARAAPPRDGAPRP